jgi:hypothetical protein
MFKTEDFYARMTACYIFLMRRGKDITSSVSEISCPCPPHPVVHPPRAMLGQPRSVLTGTGLARTAWML